MRRNLEAALARVLHADGSPAAVANVSRLAGGASRETWSFTASWPGTLRPTTRLVLRREPPGLSGPSTIAIETAAIRAAGEAGAAVPEAVASGNDALLGHFIVTRFVEGASVPGQILRDPRYDAARHLLARQCGDALARIHAAPLASFPRADHGDALERVQEAVTAAPRPSPAFEWALRWLTARQPPTDSERVLVHGDFRLGNLIINDGGLAAVLDWEAAHVGQPMEDVGWLCMRAWRFGGRWPVGGFGRISDLAAAYERTSGRSLSVGAEDLRWWVVWATLRWGTDCFALAERHLSGAQRSVELAVIGRRVRETEYDLVRLID